MYGSFWGNMGAIAYYLYFQSIGLGLVCLRFRREKPMGKLLIGSVAGSLSATWLPILFAFFFGFSLRSHILALFVTLPLCLPLLRGRAKFSEDFSALLRELGEHKLFSLLLLLFLAFWTFLLGTHTISPGADTGLYTGQCTYGDMNMHLGFVTSLARQGTFPPDYSILPGVRLSYPFLSDSISSGLYLLGASLRTAYILPMVFAMAQIFSAIYLFSLSIMRSYQQSTAVKAGILTLLLYFLNGGLGFLYFLGGTGRHAYRFSDIFTGFYTTPTNLIDCNIRWVNVVADMFLPQRATLFGYAALFPALWLLYRAAFQDHREYFLLAGFFTAALPMIHTHSFLSAAVVSAVWLLLWLRRRVPRPSPDSDSERAGHAFRPPNLCSRPGLRIFALFVLLMCLLQAMDRRGALSSDALMAIGVSVFAAAAVRGFSLLYRFIRSRGLREFLAGWGVWLACVLALALPQLLFWTLGQVSEGGFVRGHFNWGNQGDFYPWFYLKNIGAPLILILGGIRTCDRRRAPLFLPPLFLWWLSELIVFTPNTYDNNKILYVAYLLLCLGGAEYGVTLLEKRKEKETGKILTGLLSAFFLFLSSFSGILTLGREAVSRYQLYGSAHVALAEFVEENTPPDSVFLTDTRHNNEIASLTGRNIVCGADTFLYFHGLDTSQRRRDLQAMYEAPAEHLYLFEKYGVSYVVISSYERNSYAVDEAAFRREFPEVFSRGDVTLYHVPLPRASSLR